MNDEDKTKEQLKLELARLRQRIAELEGQETERKHAEEEIIHLASFPELNPSPVLELDQEGNLIYLNPATKNIFPNLATLGVNHPFLADWTQVVKELQGSNWGKTVVREVVADGLFYEQVILPVTEKRIRIDGRNITKRKQAEENIRRLAMVVRDSNDAITIHDLEGRITAWNRGAKLMYGYSEEEALQMDIWHLSPTDKEVEQKEFFRRLMAGEAIYSLETQRVTKAGRILDTWLTVTKLVDDGGTIIWIASTERDITERKRAEEALKKSEEKYRLLLEQSPIGIIATNLEGKVLSANRAMETITGYSLEELRTIDIANIYESPEDSRKFLERLSRLGVPGNYAVQLKRKDGTRCDALLNVARIHVGDTDIIQTVCVDITERKRAEEALRESEERFRAIFDNVADGILIADIETEKFYSGNKAICQMLGYSLEELRNLGVTDIHPEEDVVYNLGQFEKLSKRQISKSGDIRVKRKDSSVFYAEVNASPATFRGKTYLISTFRDITERKKMQEQLVVQDRLASIGELASGIAHEINNPLTGILGLSELILDTNVPADVREDLKTIHSEAQRTARIVQNLFAFARKQPQEKQSINVNDSISKVLELRAYEQKVSNINMITRFAPDLPEVKANAFQLQQVFINIIINAEYFMIKAHNRGTLTIATEQVDNIVRISIADDGPGIVKKNLLRMFSPFFTTKEVGKGTGLGLSICHGIVTEHGGRIYAESEVGKGATFIIELPIVPVGSGGTEK
jgi:PAS domain S-box-containing protein